MSAEQQGKKIGKAIDSGLKALFLSAVLGVTAGAGLHFGVEAQDCIRDRYPSISRADAQTAKQDLSLAAGGLIALATLPLGFRKFNR